MKLFLSAAFIVLATAAQAQQCAPGPIPDPACTSGVLNAEVTQGNIAQTICRSGWTAAIRPPVSYTNALKRQQMIAYGYGGRNPRDFEEDHLVPLELGGNPTDPHNLWPQPWGGQWGADVKDRLETALKRRVCSGQTMLAEARALFLAPADWRQSYVRIFGRQP